MHSKIVYHNTTCSPYPPARKLTASLQDHGINIKSHTTGILISPRLPSMLCMYMVRYGLPCDVIVCRNRSFRFLDWRTNYVNMLFNLIKSHSTFHPFPNHLHTEHYLYMKAALLNILRNCQHHLPKRVGSSPLGPPCSPRSLTRFCKQAEAPSRVVKP